MKKQVVISNAFSVNMISSETKEVTINITRLSLNEAKMIVKSADKVYSIIGHSATAKVLSDLLGYKVEVNRVFYTLNENDLLLVFVLGKRLREGEVVKDLDEIRKSLRVFAITMK